MDELAICRALELAEYSKFMIKLFYYKSIDDHMFYVYSGKQRICHIIFLSNNYCYMNDCIDGAHWTHSIHYSDVADLRKRVIKASAEVELIALNYLKLYKRYPTPGTTGFCDQTRY